MSGKLEKMVIKGFKEPDYSGTPEEYTVMFNPTSYSQNFEVEYEQDQAKGTTGSPQVYTKIKPKEYSFDFIIDGTGVSADKKDVNKEIENFFSVTAKYEGEIHRPKYLKIVWGKFLADCVLKSADVTYTLFNPDGSPLRAKISAKFVENIEDVLRVKEEDSQSPDLTHVITVKAGDTLPLMSYKTYGDSQYYIDVAEVNNLKNFRTLKPGMQLIFPPIAK